MSWLSGMLAAAWMTGTALSLSSLIALAVLTWLLATASGLCTGLYRHRYQRGSLDELAGIGMAAAAAGLVMLLLSAFSLAPSPVGPRTVAGAGVFALAAMLAGRHVLVALRQRTRPPATTATDIIVFGACEAWHDPGSPADAGSAGQVPAGRPAGRRPR